MSADGCGEPPASAGACQPSLAQRAKAGGEGGIRTLGRGFSPYNGLANRRLQPLGHLTVSILLTISAIRRRPIHCAVPCAIVRRTFAARTTTAWPSIASSTIAYGGPTPPSSGRTSARSGSRWIEHYRGPDSDPRQVPTRLPGRCACRAPLRTCRQTSSRSVNRRHRIRMAHFPGCTASSVVRNSANATSRWRRRHRPALRPIMAATMGRVRSAVSPTRQFRWRHD